MNFFKVLFVFRFVWLVKRIALLYGGPEVIQLWSELRVSVRRMKQFLLLPEVSRNQIHPVSSKRDLSEVNLMLVGKKGSINATTTANESTICLRAVQRTEGACIEMNNASFSWDLTPTAKLKRVLTSKKKKMGKNEQLDATRVRSESELTGIRTPNVSTSNMSLMGDSDRQLRHQLSNISLKINSQHNSFVAIVGKIGSGKSSLLSAILGGVAAEY